MYRHVFGKISSEFCGISRVFMKFAGFRGFIYLKFAAPQPRELSEP